MQSAKSDQIRVKWKESQFDSGVIDGSGITDKMNQYLLHQCPRIFNEKVSQYFVWLLFPYLILSFCETNGSVV